MEYILALGKELGIKEIEVYSTKNTSLSIAVYNGKIDSTNKSVVEVVSIKGVYRGNVGRVSIENFDEKEIVHYLRSLIDNAKVVSVKEPAILFKGAKKYQLSEAVVTDLNETPLNKKMELVLNLDKALKGKTNVLQVQTSNYMESQVSVKIINTKGLNVSRELAYCGMYSVGVFSKDGDIQTAFEVEAKHNFKDLNTEKLASKIAKIGNSKLGGSSMPSGNYPVVINNSAFGDLLNTFTSIFNGEMAFRGMSPLKGKENTVIGNELVSIYDDPFNKKALFTTPFDDEGVPCRKKAIVNKGVFTGFLQSLKSAKMNNVKPTGNGFRRGISPAGLTFQSGKTSHADLLVKAGNGVYITELQGLHAGVNQTSGNFSLQCNGFLIENGVLGRPVKLIVLSGNFFKLLNEITAVGNDAKYEIQNGVTSPSVLIPSLAIGGQ